MEKFSRREFSAIALGSLAAQLLFPERLSSDRDAQESAIALPPRDFVYSSEITHNDSHDLLFGAEEVRDRIKWYHKSEPQLLPAFERICDAADRFHDHMHTDYDDDHYRTIQAFRRVVPAIEGLEVATRGSEARHYFDRLHGFYESLRTGVVPGA